MANLMNLTPVHAPSIPDSFLLPVDCLRSARTDVSLPVIDMSQGRDEVRRAILDSGKEYGFLQVVNHGISEQVMRDMYAVCHEFNEMPAADKVEFYSEDESKPNRLYGGVNFETLDENCWMDTLELVYPLPSGDTKDWPHKPQRLREEFVSEDNPPRYRSLTFGEFKRMHHVVHLGSSINQMMNIKHNQNGI